MYKEESTRSSQAIEFPGRYNPNTLFDSFDSIPFFYSRTKKQEKYKFNKKNYKQRNYKINFILHLLNIIEPRVCIGKTYWLIDFD